MTEKRVNLNTEIELIQYEERGGFQKWTVLSTRGTTSEGLRWWELEAQKGRKSRVLEKGERKNDGWKVPQLGEGH